MHLFHVSGVISIVSRTYLVVHQQYFLFSSIFFLAVIQCQALYQISLHYQYFIVQEAIISLNLLAYFLRTYQLIFSITTHPLSFIHLIVAHSYEWFTHTISLILDSMKLDSNNFSSRIHSQTTTYLAIRIQPVISVSTYFNLALGVLDNFFSYTSAIAVQDQQCFFGFYSSILLVYLIFDRHNKINSSTNMHVAFVILMIISLAASLGIVLIQYLSSINSSIYRCV